MNMWTKIGCLLTGWSKEVILQCSEASRCQLSKYTSAMIILILIWGVTGFCFAQRYIGLPVWGCALVALFFITIVIMIERQILLTIEKSFKLLAFRAVIAFVMAIVGSTIFDQNMFGKDIDKQMAQNIEVQTAELSQQRLSIIDAKLAALRFEKDSINAVNAVLQADINKNPFVIQKSVTTSQQKIVVDGEIQTVTNPSVTTNQVANPKQSILESNNQKLLKLTEQEEAWSQKKQTVEEDVRTECKASVGFLEELEAMWTIITTRPLAGGFYLVFFFLLMSLELFVVVSKTIDKECDYDAALKGMQKVRVAQFNKAFSRLNL
jgi:hypothetical protein